MNLLYGLGIALLARFFWYKSTKAAEQYKGGPSRGGPDAEFQYRSCYVMGFFLFCLTICVALGIFLGVCELRNPTPFPFHTGEIVTHRLDGRQGIIIRRWANSANVRFVNEDGGGYCDVECYFTELKPAPVVGVRERRNLTAPQPAPIVESK